MTTVIKGLDLCESFFNEVGKPVLAAAFPGLPYAAGVIGWGSEVIGYDDEMSTDHNWGPRFQLFLPEADFAGQQRRIADALVRAMPYEYGGFSTNFGLPDQADGGTRLRVRIRQGPVDPFVEYHTLRSYFERYLGYTPFGEMSPARWLTFGEHRLLGVTSGRVFHDELGLGAVRAMLGYFPHDVWLWMMAAEWQMLAEEEAFVGRCGWVGDEVGSRLVAARQVQRLMRLCFLMEKRYAPYSKWFGSAFGRLEAGPSLLPALDGALGARTWGERETHLGHAYQLVAKKHNRLGITEALSTDLRSYFDRPFKVLSAGRFAEAVRRQIENAELKHLVPEIGSVSQFTDSTAVFDDVSICRKLAVLYG